MNDASLFSAEITINEQEKTTGQLVNQKAVFLQNESNLIDLLCNESS